MPADAPDTDQSSPSGPRPPDTLALDLLGVCVWLEAQGLPGVRLSGRLQRGHEPGGLEEVVVHFSDPEVCSRAREMAARALGALGHTITPRPDWAPHEIFALHCPDLSNHERLRLVRRARAALRAMDARDAAEADAVTKEVDHG